jgi:hypothetical protein
LTDIPDGKYIIVISATGSGGYSDMSTLTWFSFSIIGNSSFSFTLDTTPPNISSLSIENKTYSTSEIPLSFNVNEESQISYSIDNQANMTILGNTTLTGLADGPHTIVIYANDTAGNMGKSDTVFFTVNTQPSPTPSLSPSPSVPEFPSGVIIAALVTVTVALAVFLKRKKPIQKR